MALFHSTLLSMVLLHSTWLYITLPWLYFTLYLTPHYPTIGILDYPRLNVTIPWLYLTLHYSTIALYFTLLKSTLMYHGSTSLYSYHSSTWLYKFLLWLYLTLHNSTLIYHGFTSLHFTLHYSSMAHLHSTLLYISLQWIYFALLRSRLLYHGSTSLHYSTIALLHSTWPKKFLPWFFTLLESTL